MNYEHILESANPDKEIEYFWLTFKNSIFNYLNKSEQIEINILSDELNKLQCEQQYPDIEQYIKSHIECIGYNMIKNNDHHKINHLDTNIRRWKNITGNNIYTNDNTFYALLKIYIKLNKKVHLDGYDHYTELLSCIIKFASSTTTKDQNKINELTKLMQLSIDNQISGNIDILKYILDINDFIEDTCTLTDEFIKKTKGNKLCKYLRSFKIQNI
jgi:hypothetical protein